MKEGIGAAIKQLRELLNISQKELASDICTQSYICKVERGQVIPAADILYLISVRLGVDIDYFFENQKNSREEYAREFCQIIKEYKLLFKYEDIYHMVKNEKNNPHFRTVRMQKFLLWHEGVSLYYIRGALEVPILLLNQALDLGIHNVETVKINIEILNSIANLYNDEAKKFNLAGDLEKAQRFADKGKGSYEKALNIFNRHKMLMDDDLYIKIINNYAKLLYRTGYYKEAMDICGQGIQMNIRTNNLFHLGNLYHQKGLAHQQLKEFEQSIRCFEKARMAFSLQNCDELEEYCTFGIKVSQLLEIGISEFEGKQIGYLDTKVLDALHDQYFGQKSETFL